MQERWPSALIETPDLPGAGDLHKEKSPTKLSDYIPILRRQLTNSKEQAIVVGFSLGGMLALTWAKQSPELFKHVVTINSSSAVSPFYKRLLLYRAWRQPGAIFRVTTRVKERAVYMLTCNTRPPNLATIDRWTQIQLQRPVSMANQLRQIAAAFKFMPPAASSIPPVSVIYSNADHFVSPDCSRDLIDHYSADSYIHNWGGHDLAEDDPHWLCQQLATVVNNLN
jgi:pimeloyl-ACP methyl ester carboxylesterase